MTALSRFRLSLFVFAATLTATLSAAEQKFTGGWEATAQREEIRPKFSEQRGSLVIATGDSAAEHGQFQKTFPLTGGKWYRFEALRKTANVETPRRSTPVRIVWQDEKGKAVLADPTAGREKEAGAIPLAEPEHP